MTGGAGSGLFGRHMSEPAKQKRVDFEISLPVKGYRRWLRATHFAVHHFADFAVVRFVFQPETTPLDDCVVVIG